MIPLSSTILLIWGNKGSSLVGSSITSIISGMLIVIPSILIVALLRFPNPSTPVQTVVPAILFCIKKSNNTLYNSSYPDYVKFEVYCLY